MGSRGFSHLKPRLLFNSPTALSLNAWIKKKRKKKHLKRKQLLRNGHLHGNHLVSMTKNSCHPVPHHTDKRGIKRLFPLHCPAGVNFFQYSSSGWRHFSSHFPLVLQCNSFFFFFFSFSPLHFFPPATAVCGSLNCVLLPSRRQYHYHIFAVKGLQRMVLSWASVI